MTTPFVSSINEEDSMYEVYRDELDDYVTMKN